jgi:hypothetical protein
LSIAGGHRNHPRVASDGRTSHRSLIARRSHGNNAAVSRVVQCLLQLGFAFRPRLNEGGTQVDDAGAGINALDNGRSKFFRSRARHLCVAVQCFCKNRTQQQRTTRIDRRRHGTPPGKKYPRHKCSMHTRNAFSSDARSSKFSGDFTNGRASEVGMVQNRRPVDQGNRDLRAALAAFHQVVESD